jgi:hypothetical protein
MNETQKVKQKVKNDNSYGRRNSQSDTTLAHKNKKRKKTERSGNAFVRIPKQGLLISRYNGPIILRFD